ncbi:PQQ-dependent sugar dehydrogenase [Lacunimicrobium album]
MRAMLSLWAAVTCLGWIQAANAETIATGLKGAAGVCVGRDGTIYVTQTGEVGVDKDGQISVIKAGKVTVLADELDDPRGITLMKEALFVCDKGQVKKVTMNGHVETYLEADDFPGEAKLLRCIDSIVDAKADRLVISDADDSSKARRAVYMVDVRSKRVTVYDDTKIKNMEEPRGVAFDGNSFALVADQKGLMYRINLETGDSSDVIKSGLTDVNGITWDDFGQLFLSSSSAKTLWGIPRPGQKPVVIKENAESFSDLCIDNTNNRILAVNEKDGSIVAMPKQIPGFEVDATPMKNVSLEVAFPNLKWTGWDDGSESGRPVQHRPILLTHAGDGSGRIFVPLQQGPIHVFKEGDTETKVFLDLSDRNRYLDRQNEEGFLGLAFSPDYKQSGEFYVFYTLKNEEHTNVVSRFRVSKNDPNKADINSEEILLKITHPYWNHDGGTLVFGQDGFLYVVVGDGGAGNDPHENGQNLGTHLGKILRLDVQKRKSGYGIPADNPFVDKAGAKPEIFAYGVRNIWRLSVDRKTGDLWAAEVGQNLFEEINIVTRGANLGWSLRESFHPFGAKGVDVNPGMLEPIWEYYHDIGRSITGGQVYRGKKSPALDGVYLYSDYVSNLVWGLTYDAQKGRVTANRPIAAIKGAWMSLGEDEDGEVYIMTYSGDGKAIYRFVAK